MSDRTVLTHTATPAPSPVGPESTPDRPQRFYVTTSIPYVNSAPHLGHALELVQADALARHRRLRGDEVRFQSGTDDNALTNVQAAEAAGVPVADLVNAHADTFEALRGPLELSWDDFLRTSSDPRHRPGAERLWRACADAGDLYRRHYDGLYCVSCEAFYTEDELVPGDAGPVCPVHRTRPERVNEDNWFFRLSRYQEQLRDLVAGGPGPRVRIEPPVRANETLAFIDAGLSDISVSRPVERARGWGVPVPGDPGQVMYVWFDALGNYVTSLGYGEPVAEKGATFRRWWSDADRQAHVIGKDIWRFHTVYWPAFLLSAGLPVPQAVFVHDFLTANGQKLSKSLGNVVDPVALTDEYGADALRWWLLSQVPRVGDTDFTVERLVEVTNRDLAGGVGNLVRRVVTMVHRYQDGVVPPGEESAPDDEPARRLRCATAALPGRIDDALDAFDHRSAAQALLDAIAEANRYVEETAPWALAKATDGPSRLRLAGVLSRLVTTCRLVASELAPFAPSLAERASQQCRPDADGRLPESQPVFPRIDVSRS